MIIKKVCSVEECEKYAVSHSMCDTHRKRLRRSGSTKPTRPNDWGEREKHPLYSIWVGHRRYNTKHPLDAVIHGDFWEFSRVISSRPSKTHHLRPIDAGHPISSDNYHWVEVAVRGSGSQEHKDYLKGWAREDRRVNPDKYREKSLMRQFGIGIKEYDIMLKSQNGVCDICSSPESAINPHTKKARNMAVDHCHKTGKIRGLLCSLCNSAIGNFDDDIDRLRAAIQYLVKGAE